MYSLSETRKPGYTSGRIENGGGVGEFRENGLTYSKIGHAKSAVKQRDIKKYFRGVDLEIVEFKLVVINTESV